MKFPIIHDDICPAGDAVTPCQDSRCVDPAFASAHPELCGSTGKLILKPARMVLCAQNELQFAAYLSGDNGEQLLTAGVVFSSGDTSILTINASTGLATVVRVGNVIVTATWQEAVANSSISVIAGAGDCCSGIAVRAAVLLDVSNSEKQQPLAGPWGTRSAFGYMLWKYGVLPGMTYVDGQGTTHGDGKNYETVINFARTPSLLNDWGSSVGIAAPDPTQTDIAAAFQFALDRFATAPPDTDGRALLKAIILISDGDNRPQLSSDAFYDLLQKANNFRAAGGVIVCMGLRASADGFTLLKELADPGFFFNATADNYGDALEALQNMMCGLCASLLGERGCDEATLTPLIPTMTDNDSPSGEVKRFDTYSGNGSVGPPDEEAPDTTDFRAFDGDDATAAAASGYDDGYGLVYDFGTQTQISAWSIKSAYQNFTHPGLMVTLKGRNPDGSWSDIDTQAAGTTLLDETYPLPGPVTYSAYWAYFLAPGNENGALGWVGYPIDIYRFQVYSEDCTSGGHGCGAIDDGPQVPDPMPLTDIEG